MPGFTENHVIDDQVFHSGKASARIDRSGYYYSRHFTLPAGTKITARWWAKCSTETGAQSLLYYWRDGKAFAQTYGPVASVDEWRQYELTDTVPEGTAEICLTLQFEGDGQCWYDDAEVTSDATISRSAPAAIEPIGDGMGGVVVRVDGRVHALLLAPEGGERVLDLDGREFRSSAPYAVVTIDADGTFALAPTGVGEVTVGGVPVRRE
jgi:hypothetical protein